MFLHVRLKWSKEIQELKMFDSVALLMAFNLPKKDTGWLLERHTPNSPISMLNDGQNSSESRFDLMGTLLAVIERSAETECLS